MSWSVYILLCDQKTFYVGVTDNIKRRLEQHRAGYSPFTKKFSDIKLAHQENFQDSLKAKKRERQLKGWSIAKKKALISGDRKALVTLSKSPGLVEEGGG